MFLIYEWSPKIMVLYSADSMLAEKVYIHRKLTKKERKMVKKHFAYETFII